MRCLRIGKLLFSDCVIRGRDDLDAMMLSGISDRFTDIRLSPRRLSPSVQRLVDLEELELKSPSAWVPVSLQWAGIRNEEELERLRNHILCGTPGANIETVAITGDEDKDSAAPLQFGALDAVLDFSPAAASKSAHLNGAIKALRRKGRVSLTGGFPDGPLPSFRSIANDIAIKGKFMYERDDMMQFVRMLERGQFPKGKTLWSPAVSRWMTGKALDMAADYTL